MTPVPSGVCSKKSKGRASSAAVSTFTFFLVLSAYYWVQDFLFSAGPCDFQEKKREHFKKDHYADNNFGRNDNNHDSFGEKDSKHFYSSKNTGFRSVNKSNTTSFEDKLSRFLKDSDERLLDLKRNVESKRGGRGAKRSD